MTFLKLKFLVSFAIISITLSSCGGGGKTTPRTVCNLNTDTISFDTHVLPIFNNHCLECHLPGTVYDQKPYLSVENAYNNLVGNPIQAPGVVPFVKIGDPENSQIYRKVTGDERAGDQMPLAREHLSSDQQCIIEKWIEQGAKNN